MSRTQGASDRPDLAARVLTDKAFQRGIRLTRGQLETLDAMAYGKFNPRNSRAILGAIRLKMEWGHAKPAQEHELSGNVTISVISPVPTRASHLKAKALPVATGDTKVLEGRQGPITRSMSTSESGEIPMELETAAGYVANEQPPPFDPIAAPTVHQDGRLIATDEPKLTAEERREKARADWLADKEPSR